MTDSRSRATVQMRSKGSKELLDRGSRAAVSRASNDSNARRSYMASGTSGKSSQTQVQVIWNGKIVTPQSLIRRHRSSKESGSGSSQQQQQQRKPSDADVPAAIGNAAAVHESSSAISVHASAAETREREVSSHTRLSERFGTRSSLQTPTATQAKVEGTVCIQLTETGTGMLFAMRGLVVASESREFQVVEKENERYRAMCAKHANTDQFNSHATQTLNYPLKNQNEMAAPSAARETSTQVTSFELMDEFDDGSLETERTAEFERTARMVSNVADKYVNDIVTVSLASKDCLLDVSDIRIPPPPQPVARKERANMSGSNVGSKSRSRASGPLANTDPGTRGSGGNQSSRGHSRGHFREGSDDEGSQQAPIDETNAERVLFENEVHRILGLPSLVERLRLVNRAMQQSAYYSQHLAYHELPVVQRRKLLKEDLEDGDEHDFGGRSSVTRAGVGSKMTISRKPSLFTKSTISPDNLSVTSMHDQHIVEETLQPEAEDLELLWSYDNPLTEARTVTCLAWNPGNHELLAVGYGKLDFLASDQRGLVLIWSIRNPEHPERIIETPDPVTSLDFSTRSPNILAVGMYSGVINVYDIRREGDPLIESSHNMPGGHNDPVWQVSWRTQGAERSESIVSISTDGRVLEWNIQKGLTVAPLMFLKSVENNEGVFSRQGSGMCFEFSPTDSGTYVAGTEHGQLHKCSVSYSEQYLDTFTGHKAPVNRLLFSPFWHDVFATCSADWTINIWSFKETKPLATLHPTGQAEGVNDIAWCPGNSTVLAAVTDGGRLQIWDLAASTIDPIIDKLTEDPSDFADYLLDNEGEDKEDHLGDTFDSLNKEAPQIQEEKKSSLHKLIKTMKSMKAKRKTTVVKFSPSAPAIAVGDNRGSVNIYLVRKPASKLLEDDLQQIQRLRAALHGEAMENRFEAPMSPLASPMAMRSPHRQHSPSTNTGRASSGAASELRLVEPPNKR